jgi:hypothetical protein
VQLSNSAYECVWRADYGNFVAFAPVNKHKSYTITPNSSQKLTSLLEKIGEKNTYMPPNGQPGIIEYFTYKPGKGAPITPE